MLCNATRDYIDFAALAKHMGIENTVDILKNFNSYYSDLIRGKPGDLDQIDLSQYKGIQAPFDSWIHIVKICEEISVELGDLLNEFQRS